VKWLRSAWSEFIGLFVDDLGLALAVVAWLAAIALAVSAALGPTPWRGPLLFLGLAAIFVENTLRRARK
jgi:hypothetical protein